MRKGGREGRRGREGGRMEGREGKGREGEGVRAQLSIAHRVEHLQYTSIILY